MKLNTVKTKLRPTKVTIVAFDLRSTNAQITSTCSVKEATPPKNAAPMKA
jgi:hypothetical protein